MKKTLLISLCMLKLISFGVEDSEASLYGPEFGAETKQLLEESEHDLCNGARFRKSDWLLLDTFGIKKCLYISTPGCSIHRINLEKETIPALIANKGSLYVKSQSAISDESAKTNLLSDRSFSQGNVNQDALSNYESSNEYAYLFIHPSGDYMYIIGENSIYKSIYNREREEFQTPRVFSGTVGQKGSLFRIPQSANLLLSWCEKWKD